MYISGILICHPFERFDRSLNWNFYFYFIFAPRLLIGSPAKSINVCVCAFNVWAEHEWKKGLNFFLLFQDRNEMNEKNANANFDDNSVTEKSDFSDSVLTGYMHWFFFCIPKSIFLLLFAVNAKHFLFFFWFWFLFFKFVTIFFSFFFGHFGGRPSLYDHFGCELMRKTWKDSRQKAQKIFN